jgi:hypothetical protein
MGDLLEVGQLEISGVAFGPALLYGRVSWWEEYE